MPKSDSKSPLVLGALVAAVAMLFFAFHLPGIRWGLPSDERNALYYTTPEAREEALQRIRQQAGTLPRSLYNPIRAYHPDEYIVLKMLARMRPWKLEMDPEWYVIGGGYVYPLGALLKLCDAAGALTLKSDVTYYIERPGEMAKLYLVGRVLSLVLAAAAIALTGLAASRVWGRFAGGAAALTLALSPLLFMHAHFMYNDVPGMFWVTLTMVAASRIFKHGGRRWYVLAGIAAGLAAGTKLFHGVAILVPAAAHLFRDRGEPEDDARKGPPHPFGSAQGAPCPLPGGEGTSAPAASRAADLVIMCVLALAILIVTNPYYVLRPGAALENFSRHVWRGAGFAFYLRSMSFGFGVLPLAACAVALATAAIRRDRFALILGGWLVIYYVLLSIFGKQFARYLMAALPAAAMLCGSLICLARAGRRGVTSGGHEATAARQKGPRGGIRAAICAIVVISAPQLATDWDIVLTLWREDSRTAAGRAILERLPPGATVAVTEEPWQFEMPPIDQTRYKVAVVGYDVEKLLAAGPNAFIYSDLQSDPEINPHPEFPTEAAFWGEVSRLTRGGEWHVLYETPARADGPKFWSALWLWKHPPEDLRYVSPRVVAAAPR